MYTKRNEYWKRRNLGFINKNIMIVILYVNIQEHYTIETFWKVIQFLQRLLQQSAAAIPDLGCGVSPLSRLPSIALV